MNDRGKLFQAAKRRVLKTTLIPAGFEKGKGMFVRKLGEHVQGLELQASKFGGCYFVNLAFSYSFLPGFVAFYQKRRIEYKEFCILDFLTEQRMEHLVHCPCPSSWSYGGAETEENVQLSVNMGIAFLNDWGARWRDPVKLMEAIPEDMIAEELALLRRTPPSFSDATKLPTSRVLGAIWRIDQANLALGLCLIARKRGMLDRAKAYLQVVRSLSSEKVFTEPLDRLKRELDKSA